MAEVAEAERNSLHAEKSDSDAPKDKETQERPLKLDAQGLPLAPQPSDRDDDPLVRLVLCDINRGTAEGETYPGNTCSHLSLRTGPDGTSTMF